jgi:NADH-quinone oxidoreductase subunit N
MYSILSLSITGLITLFLGFSENKKLVWPASMVFLLIALGLGFLDWNAPGTYFNGMLEVNNTTIVFGAVVILTAFLILGFSENFERIEFAHSAEYFALIQFSLVGALMMMSYNNLIMLFLGVEILSVAMYVLTGADKRNIRGNEAAIKYFLMGAFATGILLFGMAMLYGATGTLSLGGGTPLGEGYEYLLYIGCTLLLIGLLFKVAAAPFHFWTPDVYEGAPAIFTAYMATIVKTAGFVALIRVLTSVFSQMSEFWWIMVAVMIVLSLVIGNIGAIGQQSFKRLLAYSSISHAGFMTMALLGSQEKSVSDSILFYSAAYNLATITAFGVLLILSRERLENGRVYEKVDLFKGLSSKNTLLTVALVIAMLSMAGIPLTAGFWGKFFVFRDVASSGYFWLIIVAVVMSAVSVYYYFRPIILAMNKSDNGSESLNLTTIEKLILSVTTMVTVLLGIFPGLLRYILN